MAISVLVMIFAACCRFVVCFTLSLASIEEYLFVLDETISWMLVAGFSYLMVASMLSWVKETLPLISSKLDVVQTA